MKRITLLLLIALITVAGALADQPMETSEIVQLFEQLCQRPATNWIEQGRIEAVNRSSDIASGEVTETLQTVTTDSERFIWQLQITSHGDSVESKKKDMSDFLEWNQDRTFVWDGQTYTLYFKPGNQAIVRENPSMPPNVNGPLTAGYVPWGQGIFTFESLSASEFSAIEAQTENGVRIQLFIQPTDRMQMQFVLDPAKENAVLSYTLLRAEGSRVVQTYGNFIEQQSRWIPMDILIDRYQDDQLLSSDMWEVLSVEDTLPKQNPFVVSLQDNALVQYHSPLLDKPVFYRQSIGRDIEPLLNKRFMHGLKKQNKQKRNCGSVAVEQILSKFDISIEDSQAESLVDAVSGDTTLYQIQQLIQEKGLNCLPVKTNIAGLKRFNGSQILLHFPKKKHFVVLDRINQKTAWIIDLDRQKFYHKMELSQLGLEWAGIALVVSDTPLSLGERDKPVPDPILKNITGSADYSCSDLIHSKDEPTLCPKMVQGTCGGRYVSWESNIYACKQDSGGGFCSGTGIVGGTYSPCIVDAANPDMCTLGSEGFALYIRACLQ